MDHHRISAAKAALAVALIGFVASAEASVTWDVVGTAAGEPDVVGTAITPDIPVNCSFGPPAGCPISGTLTIPAGAMGGPGTTIDLATDPDNVIISISTSPPTPGDDFFIFDISKDGYTCNSSSSFVLQCDFDNTTAFYSLVLTEQVPSVTIGNGNVHITGQYLVNGQSINPPPPTSIYAIGDTGPAGGKVFYVTDGGLHGLEAAPIDQAEAPWGCAGVVISGADGTTIGTGAQNTADIIAGCAGEYGYAARFASSYSLNGFDDWFLPSLDELNQLYVERAVLDGAAFGTYWSSTEVDGASAWIQRFNESDPGQGAVSRASAAGVRAIRAF